MSTPPANNPAERARTSREIDELVTDQTALTVELNDLRASPGGKRTPRAMELVDQIADVEFEIRRRRAQLDEMDGRVL